MPLYQIPFDAAKGPHLEVVLSKAESIAYRPGEVEQSKRRAHLLIDSGASRTSIFPSLARDMGLLPIGKTKLRSATQEVLANEYFIDLTCDGFSPPFILRDLTIIEFPLADGWRDGFLGRDFLDKVVLEINGPGKYCKIIV
jgi:hypothetical protein